MDDVRTRIRRRLFVPVEGGVDIGDGADTIPAFYRKFDLSEFVDIFGTAFPNVAPDQIHAALIASDTGELVRSIRLMREICVRGLVEWVCENGDGATGGKRLFDEETISVLSETETGKHAAALLELAGFGTEAREAGATFPEAAEGGSGAGGDGEGVSPDAE